MHVTDQTTMGPHGIHSGAQARRLRTAAALTIRTRPGLGGICIYIALASTLIHPNVSQLLTLCLQW